MWIPHPVEFNNYSQALASEPFGHYFLNTLLYCVLTVIGVCLSSSLIADGFSRLRWPGRDVLFSIMVATLLLPFIVTLIPLFVLYKDIGWVGSQTVDHPDVLWEFRGECRKEEHVAETDHGEHQSADSQTEADASHDAPPVAK